MRFTTLLAIQVTVGVHAKREIIEREMIEIIKKKYKEGSIITIFTENDSFKGKIIEFSDNYIELETENTTEILSIKNIVRFSIPKGQDLEQNKKQEKKLHLKVVMNY